MEVRPTKWDTQYFVSSESGDGEYQLMNVHGVWKCTCKAYIKTKQPCKHVHQLLAYLKEQVGGGEPEEGGGMAVPPPSTPKPTLSKWVKQIHGREFITYEGLLAMAHEQGLMLLRAEFVSVTETLALAIAWATFRDGREFREAADATPTNVNANVKAHFPRVALTRAKARVLRDALNIGMIAVEELEE